MRQRPDGTWTHTTEAWDAKWYWPVGTRVDTGLGPGVVVKTNRVSVWLQLDSGAVRQNVSVLALTRADSTPATQAESDRHD